VSISSDDDTDSTRSDGKYDSECESDVDMRLDNDVDTPDYVELDSEVDMESDGEDEEDEEVEDKKEEEMVDEDEEEDENENENNGKEPQTIGQREMVNSSADDADTMVDDQPTLLCVQRQEMREHTPWPRFQAPAPRIQIREPCPRPPSSTTLVSV
jgi:archaellum component FlaD/FlaE